MIVLVFMGSLASAQPRSASSYQLDGIRIGRTVFLDELFVRSPWSEPCDIDPIDRRARSIVVYGARPCRERSFPERTSVALLLKRVEGQNELAQPVEAIAWLGGSYFASRSDFPVQPGASRAEVARALGRPTRRFAISDSRVLSVEVHAPDVFSIVIGERVVGFVLGMMPSDPESEQWRMLSQLYHRFTSP